MGKLFLGLLILLVPTVSRGNESPPLEGRVLIIDAGHGTINFQSKIINAGKKTLNNTPEHQLTLEISERLAATLKELGATVYLTRTATDYWRPSYNSTDDNKARAIFANELKGDALLSIHCDWHPNRKAHGVTTLYAKRNSRKLGAAIHRSLVRRLHAKDRRLVKNDFTILDNATMPALIIETGFMSHWREYKKLKNPRYQKKIAEAVAKGVVSYFKK